MSQPSSDPSAEEVAGVGRDDVSNAYAVFLGREPESDEAIVDKLGLSPSVLLKQFATSTEFEDKVERPVMDGGLPTAPLFRQPPSPGVTAWASAFLPLTDEGRARVVRTVAWPGLFESLFRDADFQAALPELQRLFPPGPFFERLSQIAASVGERVLEAEIETASRIAVGGWALDRAAPEVPVAVELWIDGAFAGAAVADIYRRDLQERFSTSGAHGYLFESFAPRDERAARRVRIEVRDSASKAVLQSRRIDWRPDREAAQVADIGRQLDGLRDALERMEDTVRRVTGAFGYTAAAWDTYWRAYYPVTPADREVLRREAEAFVRRPSLLVIVAGEEAGGADIEATLQSLRDQSWRDFRIALAGDIGDPQAIRDLALAPAARFEASDASKADYAVVVDAGDRLSLDALHRFVAACQTQDPVLIYGDSDRVVVSPQGRERHVDPVLRSDFDLDLLLQTPALGSVAAVRGGRLGEALAQGASLAVEARGDLFLRVIGTDPSPRIVHVPRVLHHAVQAHPQRGYGEAVEAHLQRTGAKAEVAAHSDDFGVAVEGAARLTWPLPARTRAAVIVPTRDRLDLLGPCLASLIACRKASAVELEIVVVDNGSTEATTLRFLNALEASGGITRLGYPAAFNWSAINNHAARLTEADVLIFLNNDTVVLEQGFADALCRQALRQEVGAVGARLLYEDGTIQHAGVILGVGDGVGLHEGVGAALDDPGYLSRRALVHRASAVTGACLATRADVFSAVGGFDEAELAIEGNDIDYCLRVQRAGLAVLYEPAATLYHFESRSRGHTGLDAERRTRADRELATLRARWGDALRHDPFYNSHFDPTAQPFARLGPPSA